MEILNICGTKMAVGLEWEIIPPDVNSKLDKAMRDIAKTNGCKYGMTFTFENIVSAGFSTKKFSEAPGALYLAFAHQEFLKEIDRNDPNVRKDWIYIDKDTDNDRYWMSVVKEGIPTPGFDIVVADFKELEEKLMEILRVDTYIVNTPLNEVQAFFYERGYATPIEKKNFDDLVTGIDLKKVKKLAKFKKLVGIPSTYLLAGAIFILLIMSFFVYDEFAKVQKKKSAQANRAKSIAAEKNKEEQNYSNSVKTYYENFYKTKDEAFDKVNPIFGLDTPAALAQWGKVLNFKIPTSGWKVTDIKCSVKPENIDAEKLYCVKNYSRGTDTTNKMLAENEEGAFLSSPTSPNAKSEYKMPILKTGANIQNYNFMLIDEFALNFVSDMQVLKYSGVEFTLAKAPEEITFTPPALPVKKVELLPGQSPPPPAPVAKIVPLKIGFAKGNYSLKGTGYHRLNELLAMMNWRSFSVTNLNITTASYDTVNWDLSVDYVIKTTADKTDPPRIAQYGPESFGLPKAKP